MSCSASRPTGRPRSRFWSRWAWATWRWTGLEGIAAPLNGLVRAPSAPERLYASAARSLWRSDDGLAWEQVVAPPSLVGRNIAELNGRFADWYYIIPESTYRDLQLSLDTLIQPKSAAEPSQFGQPGGQFSPPGGFNFGN